MTEEHIVFVATEFGELFNIWSDIDALRTDEDLGCKVKRVEEVLIGVFDTLAFSFGHEVEVDGLTSNNGTEGSVFHNNH